MIGEMSISSSVGLRTLNVDQEKFGNVQLSKPRYDSVAYCSSGFCAGRGHTAKPVKKIILKSSRDCPDCGNVLFFKMEKSKP